MVTGVGTVSQPTTAGVITSTTMGNNGNATTVIQGTQAGNVESNMPPRRTNDNRRSNKPIMEKRRRARINNCLNELKTLILDAMKKDPARHSKLEKADILEMTVKHLENLQRQQAAMSAAADPTVINKFRAGFSECASEVGRFPGLEPTVKRRLLQHLANCLQVGAGTIITNNNNNILKTADPQPILAAAVATTTAVGTVTAATTTTPTQQPPSVQLHILPTQNAQTPSVITATTTANNANGESSHIIQHNGIFFTNGNGTGVQLVPTRLPNGDIALVLPTNITTATTQLFSTTRQPTAATAVHSPSPQSTNYGENSSSPTPTVIATPISTTQQLHQQPSPQSITNSTSPLPMLIPIPARTSTSTTTIVTNPHQFHTTAATNYIQSQNIIIPSSSPKSQISTSSLSPPSSATSSRSPSVSSSPNHVTSSNCYSPMPHSPARKYEPMDTTPSSVAVHVIHTSAHPQQSYSPPMQKPLSLVIRKSSPAHQEEEKPWRPW